MPLKYEYDRPLPVRSAVSALSWGHLVFSCNSALQIAVPTSMVFSRSSSIPYFVVFTTTPRSPALAREVATDATISVSLIRQVIVRKHSSPTSTLPTPCCDDSKPPRTRECLGWIGKSKLTQTITLSRDKPLPELPAPKSFSDVQTIHKDMCIGFPKRPQARHLYDSSGAESHPSLDAIKALPDGLHKSGIQLNKDMLPSIDWAGISVKVCYTFFFCPLQ